MRLDVDPASGRGFLTGDAVNIAARLQAAAPPGGVAVGAPHPRAHRRASSSTRSCRRSPPRARPSRSRRGWRIAPLARRGVDARSGELTPLVGREVGAGLPLRHLRQGDRLGRRLSSPSSSASPASARAASWRALRPRRRPTGDDHLATGLLPAVRRGHHLLGARGDRQGSRRHPRHRRRRSGRGQARGRAARRLGPRVVPSASAGAPRARSAGGVARGELRRLAALLRGCGRRATDRARLRGPALGRRGPARLPRVPVDALGVGPLDGRRDGAAGALRATPGFASGGRVNRLGLEPLSPAETARLGQQPARRAGRPRRCCRPGGRTLRRQPLLRRAVRAAAERHGARTLPLPDSVQAVIAARLDTLPADEKALLADAAVVGSVFWDGVVGGDGLARLARGRGEAVRPAGAPAGPPDPRVVDGGRARVRLRARARPRRRLPAIAARRAGAQALPQSPAGSRRRRKTTPRTSQRSWRTTLRPRSTWLGPPARASWRQSSGGRRCASSRWPATVP